MLSYLPVAHALSPIIVVFGALMLLPLAVAHGLADGVERQYDVSVLVTLLAGALLWIASRPYRGELQRQHGFLLVALAWTVLPAFATLPLLFALPQLSFTDAYFETVSAMTTTGATVLVGLDQLPASINLWRGLLQWVGGMGVVVLAVAILPLLGVGGRQLFLAETPGPIKEARLTPRIAETAKGLWKVYCIITVACILAYWLVGMTWLDAVVHAFTTLSLGGYSTHDASFGFFNSPAIEAVSIFFMLIAGVNFSTHFVAFSRHSLGAYRHDSEMVAFLVVLAASCLGIATYLWAAGTYPSFVTALRYAAFNVVSIATTTGYANTDYNVWPVFASLWMLALCSFASCSGSTGGGMKMIRVQLMAIQTWREMTRILHPSAVAPVKIRGHRVENTTVFAVLAFMLAFGLTTALATFLLTFSGLEFVTSFSAAVATITNTGPGLNEVGPAANYAALLPFQKWVLIAAMLLGRLEIFTLLVVFTPAFWRR
ncbi:MAG: potassium transporter Trk [Betaproteobacteria bacterium RIFCSPLOWO2_02_FULL_65_24]|nr:MAG: potassium transporter Trk [Betaproteobacteria bacterium RIFCSPLOWO2_02_FULL_65_24]OGA36290.1 MAG: potassium transporter Trk [Betaproteobacteria bacterium RIFCSPLOWO2_12_FULL_62_13b]